MPNVPGYRSKKPFFRRNRHTCKCCGSISQGYQALAKHYKECPAVTSGQGNELPRQDLPPSTTTYTTPTFSMNHYERDIELEDYYDSVQDPNLEVSTGQPISVPESSKHSLNGSCTTQTEQYLQSLPLLDPEYVRECVGWGPNANKISERDKITLQFLSCMCLDDGLSKKHMTAILKFIKSLNETDTSLLPNSIDGCWSILETVRALFLPLALLYNPSHIRLN